MKWLLKYPERFMHEVNELESLEKATNWFSFQVKFITESEFLEVHFNLTVHDRVYEGKLTYPDIFPNIPPIIRPRNSKERWTNHQYGAGGSLCLQWRPDNWNSEVTAADLIRNVYELLFKENSPVSERIVPSAHNLTEGQLFRYSWYRTLATNEFLKSVKEIANGLKVEILTRTLFHTHILSDFIIKIHVGSLGEKTFQDVPPGIISGLNLGGFELKGWLFKSTYFDKDLKIETAEDLAQHIREAGLDDSDVLVTNGTEGELERRSIMLCGSSPENIRHFTVTRFNENKLHENKIVMPDTSQHRLPVEHNSLGKLKIGIVGLGSIGSKICISLARSGFRDFVLFDDDLLKPENLVRHELDWADTGLHKVHAIQEKLKFIAPDINVEAISQKVGGQESPLTASKSMKSLSACNLLVDATANPEVFLILSAIADECKIPMVWGEVFAGGYGGLISRARPDLDPNPISVRNSLYTYLETVEPAPFKDAVNYDTASETPSIAYDSNVALIAASMSNLIIDTALKRDPSDYPNAIYLIGMSKAWIFSQPFDIQPVAATGAGWSVDASPSQDTTMEAVNLLLSKLKESADDKFDPHAGG